MKTNLDLMKEKLAKLKDPSSAKKETKKESEPSIFWKTPKLGEPSKHCRLLPANDSPDPFQEINLHRFDGVSFPFMSLKDLGEPDPVDDYVRELWNQWRAAKDSGNSDEQAEVLKLIKKLQPRASYYCQVLVRGEEEKGPQVWAVSKTNYGTILSKFVHEDFGDLADPKEGFDIIVFAEKTDKAINGVKLPHETKVDFRNKSTPLASKAADVEKILASRLDLMASLKELQYKNPDEAQQCLDRYVAYLNGKAEVEKLDSHPVDEALESLLKA